MIPSLSQIPLIRFIAPFVIGIITAVYFPFAESFSIYVSLGVFVTFICTFFIKKINVSYKYRWVFGALMYIILFTLGYNLTALKSSSSKPFQISNNENQVVIGEIVSPPLIKEKSVKSIIEIKGIQSDKRWVQSKGKVIVFIQKDSLSSDLKYGDYISFSPTLKNIPEVKNPNEFDYKKYLSFHLIHQQSFLKSNNWKLLHKVKNNSLQALANKLRKRLITALEENGLSGNELGVASALILGYKNNIDAQLRNAYSSAGAMHILAVSGLHVGLIFMVFNYLLQFLEKIKYGVLIKSILIILFIWSYALVTGLSPSVLRASTMFSFIVLARATKRNANFFNTLAASAFLLLIYNPYYIMDVGFQLSYIAVAGIVIIQPWLNSFYSFRYKILKYLWELTTVSVAAQIATFPLSLYYFHQFPNYFFISNLVVIPFAIFILYTGITLFILLPIPLASDIIALVLKKSIWLLNNIIQFINDLPYSVTEKIRFTFEHTLLIYIAITLIVILFISRKLKYLLASQFFIIIFLIDVSLVAMEQNQQKKILIYNIPNYSAINFIDGKDNILLSDFKLYTNKSKLMYHVENNWIEEGVRNEKVVDLDKLKKRHLLSNIYRISNKNLFTKLNYLQYYNTRIAILDKDESIDSKPLEVDILIWTKNNKQTLSKIVKTYKFKKLVIDSSNSNYTNERLIKEAELLGLNYWSVIKDGAFVYELLL